MHFERKFEDRKNIEKTVVRMLASAGDAEGGKEGLDGWTGRIQHAPGPSQGWAGGLFALRVTRRGYLEALILGGEEVERITCHSQVQKKMKIIAEKPHTQTQYYRHHGTQCKPRGRVGKRLF